MKDRYNKKEQLIDLFKKFTKKSQWQLSIKKRPVRSQASVASAAANITLYVHSACSVRSLSAFVAVTNRREVRFGI